MFAPRLAVLAAVFALAANAGRCLADDMLRVGQIVADEGAVLCLLSTNGGARVDVQRIPHAHCRLGDIIRVRYTPDQPATSLEVVGHQPLPRPRETTAAHVKGGEHPYEIVRLNGVVSAVTRDELDSRWTWFVLRTTMGPLSVSTKTNDYPLAFLQSLVDADVALTGVAVPFSSWRAPLGSHLLLNGQDSITVIRPAADPFSAPELKASHMSAVHRQTVRGTVVAATRSRFFLVTDDRRFIQVKMDYGTAAPGLGSCVTVAGFPEMDPFKIRLTDPVVRGDSTCAYDLPEPIDISPKDLFATDFDPQAINTALHGKTVRIRGLALHASSSKEPPGNLAISCADKHVAIDASGVQGVNAEDFRQGTLLEVTGLCLAEFEQAASAALFPRFKGFTLVPRSAHDIRVLASPSWWTPFRLSCVIAGLLVVIVAILIWNRAINILANRRGHELYREHMKHARAELKVEERTRLAVELHDSISQSLTGVSLQIDAAIQTGGRSLGPTLRFLETARQMLASCRHELRCCLWDLRSRTFEEKDLTEAVLKTVCPHLREANIAVRFNVPRDLLSESMTHTVLRIARELTVNAIRHGHASNVKIAGEYRNGTILFSVKDDGCGFDPKTSPGPEQGHYGLLGIRERVAQHSGTFDIQSAPGKGSKIIVTLKNDTINDNET